MNEPILLNAFPKSGTHYLAQLIQPLAAPNRATRAGISGHTAGGWGRERRQPESVLSELSLVRPGERTIAHLPADPRYAKFLYEQGWAMIFLYRDLRDVAVSQASHLPSLGQHPFGQRWAALPFERRLAEIIAGFADAPGGDWYPGLQRRWAEYAGWREWGWILPIRFEQAVEDRRGTCEAICDYLRRRTGRPWDERTIRAMEHAHRPERSPTFRNGQPGAWRQALTGNALRLARSELGPALVDLGYEPSLEW